MRRFTASLGVIALMTIMPAVPAPAIAATVVKGADCDGQVFDENGVFYGPSFKGTMVYRVTKSGMKTVTCHFDVPDGFAPSKAMHNSGFQCFVDGASTTDTRASISSGGRMVLTCRIKT